MCILAYSIIGSQAQDLVWHSDQSAHSTTYLSTTCSGTALLKIRDYDMPTTWRSMSDRAHLIGLTWLCQLFMATKRKSQLLYQKNTKRTKGVWQIQVTLKDAKAFQHYVT